MNELLKSFGLVSFTLNFYSIYKKVGTLFCSSTSLFKIKQNNIDK